MNLLAPWALAALALAGPIVALYLRRRQRARREVPSLELWRAVQRDLAHQAGLRRFRQEASLWMHLVALGLVALALAAPFRRARSTPTARLVLVVDTTASMGARDGARTRLDEARAAALRVLSELAPGGEVTLIEAGCAPTIVVATTRDPHAVRAALDALAARECGGDLSRALAVAADRLRGAGRDRRVVVVTDGTTRADAVGVSLPGRLDVVLVGRGAANVGVTAAELRASTDASDGADGARRFALFVGLASSSGASRDVTLTVDALRGDRAESVAVRRTGVAVGRSGVTIPVDLAADDAADLLRVTLSVGGGDALAVDDVAWAPVPPPRRLPVRLVVAREGASPWVTRALRADPGVALSVLTRGAWEALRTRPFDGLTVFHGAAPAEAVESEVLAFDSAAQAAQPSIAGVSLGAVVARPRWTDASPVDPRARFVGVADVHVASSREVRAEPGDVALLSASSGPLAIARDAARGSTTVVAFDPDRSDWPLRPGFVLFVRAAVEHARERATTLGLDARRTGASARIPAAGAATVRVRGPSGARDLPVREGVADWSDTERAGVYAIDRGRGAERVGLSLLDATESGLARAELPWRGAVTQASPGASWETRELSWLFALAAALVLSAEWWLHAGVRLRAAPRRRPA